MPVLQNRVYDTVAEAQDCAVGDVVLVQDSVTGLIFNAAFDPEKMHYDSSYDNEQALSQRFQRHLLEVQSIIERNVPKTAKLIEVGCGRGFFLEQLEASNWRITGFDPVYDGTNPLIQKELFTSDLHEMGDALILRHVLEHIPDPYSFLDRLRAANKGGGLIYIEVPCFDWIMEHETWFDIFYEHVNYFRLVDFKRMFSDILEIGHTFDGQYIYVVARLESLRVPHITEENSVSFPKPIGGQTEGDELGVAIWGGSSKGVIFALQRHRSGHPITTVIDINPAKQGKFLPVTGVRVSSPMEALAILPEGATIYVMNSNYLEEIRAIGGDAYEYISADR